VRLTGFRVRYCCLDLAESLAFPEFGGHRQTLRPVRNESQEFLFAAEALRYFGDDLVVDGENDRIASRLQAGHCRDEQIAGCRLHCVLGPDPAICPFTIPAVRPFPALIVFEDDADIAPFAGHQAREWIGKLAPIRQPHAEEVVAALGEGNLPVDPARLAAGTDGILTDANLMDLEFAFPLLAGGTVT
jgi:hypothetical protein